MINPDPVSYQVDNGVAIIMTDSPPVNALGSKVRIRLAAAISQATDDPLVFAILIICEGRTFFAGADISEFGKPPIEPTLRQLLGIIENSVKPVVSAIHGAALGGGLELALVTHFRIATESAKFGLPEANIGILPGAGGTQRLPRLVGAQQALDMITSGVPISAEAAFDMGLIDALVPDGTLRQSAIAFARQVIVEKRPLYRVRDRQEHLHEGSPELFEAWRAKVAKRFPGFDAPRLCVDAVEAAFTMKFEDGLVFERSKFDKLVSGPQAKALRYMFFAERKAKKPDAAAAEIKPCPVRRVGIVGAGTMGIGIAMNFANIGLPIILVEKDESALERSLTTIRKNYERNIARGELEASALDERLACLHGSASLGDLADADVIIECVPDELEVKQEIFRQLAVIARPGAILASTTSNLDVDAIAESTSRPQDVLGLHFLSPANETKVMEIVKGAKSAPNALATASEIARLIGKTGVTVGNGPGFVANRMIAARERQAGRLVLEGANPEDVDRVLRDFGFPKISFETQDVAARAGIAPRQIGDVEIKERLLFAVVNEGARLLEEKIAARASDIDVVWVHAFDWPRYSGGPMFWADQIGIDNTWAKLNALAAAHGSEFKPVELIDEMARQGKAFID